MYRLMCEAPPRTVVEVGSYLGRSTVFFALTLRDVNPSARVVSIDPHTGDRQQLEGLGTDRLPSFELFKQHCRAAGVEEMVDARVATSLGVAADWSDPVDLLYVDGWHSYEAVVADGEAWLPHLSTGGAVVFDDYLAYDEVREAVHELARRDLYRLWGSVFGQAIGGRAAEPPGSLQRALILSRGGIKRVRAQARRAAPPRSPHPDGGANMASFRATRTTRSGGPTETRAGEAVDMPRHWP
jgi:hypothetical protein